MSVLNDIDTTITFDDKQDVDAENFENIDSAKLKERIDELNSRLEELNKKEQE